MISKEEIVREARNRLGERGYSLTKMNCQHFASEVRNGTSISPEVQGVMNGAFYTSLVSVGAAIIFVASVGAKSLLRGNKNYKRE